MSETTSAPPVEADIVEPEGDTDTETVTDWEAEARHWKKMARRHEANAKKNHAKAERLDQIEAEQMSELEKARAQAEEATARAKHLEITAARATIGAKYGIDADLLLGETDEEITEHAKRLLAWREAAAPAGVSRATMVRPHAPAAIPDKEEKLAMNSLIFSARPGR